MTLPLFHLPDIIRQYNQDCHEKPVGYSATYHAQETFGFSGFNTLKQYQFRLQTINEAADLFLFEQEENEYHRQYLLPWAKQLRNRLGRRGKQNIHTTAVSLTKKTEVESNLFKKQRFYEWQARYHQYLSQLNWETLTTQLPASDHWCLKEIKARWDRGAVFSRCTNEALLFLAEQLPQLTHDFTKLKEACAQHSKLLKRMPPFIQQEYRYYLTDVVAASEQLTEQLAAMMLAKLKTWDITQGKTSTLFLSMHDQFKTLGIETPPPPSIPDPYSLTVDHFLQFHRFCERYGSRDIKRQLKHLSWFQQEAALPIRLKETNEGQFLVPASLEHYVPLKKPYLSFLFLD